MNGWISRSFICIISLTCDALNPFQEWQKMPAQQLMTSDAHAEQTLPQSQSIEYEDMMTIAIRGIIAAFHVNPSSFSEDHNFSNISFAIFPEIVPSSILNIN